MPIERRPRPNMERWYQRLTERPTYQRAVMSELT
jgi:glutathione S-transferase